MTSPDGKQPRAAVSCPGQPKPTGEINRAPRVWDKSESGVWEQPNAPAPA